MAGICFTADLVEIGSQTLIRIPKLESEKLPSRGMVMAEGSFAGVDTVMPLEPDGEGSHWFRVEDTLRAKAGVAVRDTIALSLRPVKDWPEPETPEDLIAAFTSAPDAHAVWLDITPMARWDWIRWMRATNSAKTRQGRIDKMMSMLTGGKRRPCCFNRSLCTDVSVSHRGILLDPDGHDAVGAA
ncbi:YdeI/OmpD-associated family protein [Kordiimonas marina]|uniref:YdeI/OmpD-associated family protein n=1 Tax=Kordiimonas marina TaxID=2872312 RepID=UPI001FF67D7E|nr:YdeI/OmpD-associated family protein [Kordiimonas marina]MCJ9430167.1 YdeI/OmpD-associated family protein [Kordiimonas marina]